MSITHAQDRLEVVRDDRMVDLDSAPHDDAGPLIEVVASPVGARPTFTITEAAAACGVSRKTVTRKLVDLAGHGAAKDNDGVWRIPVEALLALGLHPGRSLPAPAGTASARTTGPQPTGPAPAAASARPMQAGPDMVSIPRDRWDDLRIRLARAEAEAAERALALADARLALRALTAGPGPAPAPAPSVPDTSAASIPMTALPPAPGPAPDVPAAEPGPIAAGQQSTGRPMEDVASARSQAARTGGYVPAAGSAQGRKRRWWQSK